MKRNKLAKYIRSDYIPIEFGGCRPFRPNIVKGAKPIRELNYFNFSRKSIEKFYSIYESLINYRLS